MSKPPESLGAAEKETWHKVRREVPLPKSRKELFAAFQSIISQNHVQKVVVEIGKPISYVQAVEGNPPEAIPEEILDDDLMSAARNAEIETFPFSSELSPYECLFRAFAVLSAKSLEPKIILARSKKVLAQWLKFDSFDAEYMYGVGLAFSKEMPVDALLLSGSRPEEPDVIAFSLRIEMNVPSEVESHVTGPAASYEESVGERSGGPSNGRAS